MLRLIVIVILIQIIIYMNRNINIFLFENSTDIFKPMYFPLWCSDGILVYFRDTYFDQSDKYGPHKEKVVETCRVSWFKFLFCWTYHMNLLIWRLRKIWSHSRCRARQPLECPIQRKDVNFGLTSFPRVLRHISKML